MLTNEFAEMLLSVAMELGIVLIIDETANLRAAYNELQSA
jgi:glutamate-1-semialdehyde aminotransferase